ncbi:MAG TPA: tetratricopeptide repeat protein [Gemmataceae bacterium]|nr:tetratricopeptide repeat protein [Gemmataceae bacterium]
MTIQQETRNTDLVQLTALYESGDYTEALQMFHAKGLQGLLDEQPAVPGNASIALLVANLHRDLARYSTAEEYYEKALAGLARTLGSRHSGYAHGLVELATLYQLRGEYKKAGQLFDKARTILEQAVEPDPVAHSRNLQALAGLLDILGRRREAKECLTRARALIESANTPPVEMAALMLKEAWVLCLVDGVLFAVNRARQALGIYREHKGERHPATLQANYQLGRLLISLWDLEEANRLLEASATIRRERLGEEHPLHAAALEALALLRLAQGEPDEAENLARRSLTLTIATLGERHLDVAARHRTLGYILESTHHLTDAAESYEQALTIVREAEMIGDEHPQAAEIRLELAEIHAAMGENREAVEQIRTTLDMIDRHPEDVRYEQSKVCLSLAKLLAEGGGLDEAVALARRAASLDETINDPILYGQAPLLEARLRAEQGGVAEAESLIARVEKALPDLPALHPLRMEAAMSRAAVARLAGDPGRAVRLARDLANHAEKSRGERSACLVAALGFLAEQLHFSGEFVESERLYERVLDIQRRRCGPDHADLATILRSLAQLHLSRGNPAAAEVRFGQALDIRRSVLGDSHPETAEIWNDLAWLLYQAGNLIHAETLFRNALEVRRRCFGPGHSDTLSSQHGLALTALARGAPAKAAELLEESLALLGDDHPQKLSLMHTLARVCHAQGNRARALTLIRDILRVQERIFGAQHEFLVPVLGDLIQLYTGLGDYLAAREMLERIRSIRSHAPSPDPLAPAFELVCLSDSHRHLNDSVKAANLARQALALARRHLMGQDSKLVGYLVHFGRTCQARRAFRAARCYFHEALRIVRKTGGDRHPLIASLLMDLASLEIARGKPRRATPLHRQAADLLQNVHGEDHPDHAAARRTLGQHLQTLGDHAGAEEALRGHLNIVRRGCGSEHPAVAVAYQALSALQKTHGDLSGATASCRQALDIVRLSENPYDALHANLLHDMAVLCRLQGRSEEAAKLLASVLEIDRTSIGEDGIGHLNSLHELALIEAARGEDRNAFQHWQRALVFQDRQTAVFAYLSASSARDALLTTPWRLIEFLLTLSPRLPDAAEAVLASVLRWKRICPADLLPGDRGVMRHRYPAHAGELDRLFDLSVQIANRLIQGAGPEGLLMHHDLLRHWEEERQGLEERLAGVVPVLAKLRALRDADLPSLRRALPEDATFVELVRFRPRDFAEVCAGREGSLPSRYLGFVLQAGEKGVRMCDLGPAADLEGRGGAEALRVALAPFLGGRRQLLVATDGRVGRAACYRLGGAQALVRTLASGRELISPLLSRRGRWFVRLRGWLVG